VGVDDSDRDPSLVYEVSKMNVVLSAMFFSMIFPPVLLATEYLYCPVGVNNKKVKQEPQGEKDD